MSHTSVRRKKRGRPAIGQYPVLFRMSAEETAALDRWCIAERYNSRSEAIRWFISEALFAAEQKARTKALRLQTKAAAEETPKE